MIKKILTLLIVIFLFFLCCELIPEYNNIFIPIDNKIINTDNNISDEEKGNGLCFYLTQIERTSGVAYQNFDIDTARIIDDPIISYHDIISYDTLTHTLELAYSCDSLCSKLGGIPGGIPVHGKPFLVTLDSEKIYGGWFWVSYSSLSCNNVVITFPCLLSSDSQKRNEIKIDLGYSGEGFFTGEDPRNDRKIINRLIADGKAK